MKLILCRKCGDVFSLRVEEERSCFCGLSKGKYHSDGLHAEIHGKHALPLGFNNSSLVRAIHNRPKSGSGERFDSFVIPHKCPTIDFYFEDDR